MAQNAFITFDLKPRGSGDYETAYNILEKAGFIIATPTMKVFLPNTTVMGTIPDHLTAVTLRDAVEEAFKSAGLNLTSILCGIVADWAAMGDRVGHGAAAP